MTKPEFRNDDKFQRLAFRDWLRTNMPSGSQGYVVEDLDLVIRVYGKNFQTDAEGKFILVELKYGNSWIGIAQRKTFGLIDSLLRTADPSNNRYLGYYVLQYSNEDWDVAQFKINQRQVTKEELRKFLSLDAEFLVTFPAIL